MPPSHFGDVVWCREVSGGRSVLGGGLDAILGYHESGKLYLPPGESELFGVEYQTVLVVVGENVAYPLEGPLHGVGVCDEVVDYLLCRCLIHF